MDRHHLQPLLGYDWIAGTSYGSLCLPGYVLDTQPSNSAVTGDVCSLQGVLDAEDSLIERSDEFFNDLHTFRSLNKDECVHNPQEK